MSELNYIEKELTDKYGLVTRLQGDSLHVSDGGYLSVDVKYNKGMTFIVEGKDYRGDSVKKKFDYKEDVVKWFKP